VRNHMASGKPQNIALKPNGEKSGKLSQKEQSERFKKTARDLGIEESGDAFNSSLDQILDRYRTTKST
jgi:hypothetical protein